MKVSKSDILLQSIKRLMRRDALEHAKRLLLKSHPSEVASVLRQFADDEAVALLKLIKGTEIEADAFVELEGKFVETYLEITKDKEHIVHVLQNLSEDEAANLLAEDSDEDLAVAELCQRVIKGPMQR
ncbi:MAG: hypothetical protein H7A33_00695 [Deltaproteobacteria bacterium]|nr:hypothetical protein [Deltaproteobacteria bacterium]